MKYVSKSRDIGFTFLFFEEQEETVHNATDEKMFLESGAYKGTIRNVKDGKIRQSFAYRHIPVERAKQAALRLASVYVDELNLESSMTKIIFLFELLSVMNAHDLDLGRRWLKKPYLFTSVAF